MSDKIDYNIIKIYDYKTGKLFYEKSLLLIDGNGNILCVGKECEYQANLSNDCIIFSPLISGKIDKFEYTEKMIKYLLKKYIGKPSLLGYRQALIFVHEDLNEINQKAYNDLIFLTRAANVIYMDENVKGKPQTVSWENVIWQMKKLNKKLRYALEIE